MNRISIGDICLNVRDQGSGAPLLLVHGFPLDHTMWTGQIDALASQCRVIAPDLRGFGGSEVTAGTVSMGQLADDLAKLLESRGVKVEYAIHPLAGRMPGHMSVVLAEADVPYAQLKEAERINPTLETADVALVIAGSCSRPGGRLRQIPIRAAISSVTARASRNSSASP